MTRTAICSRYFNWLSDKICGWRHSPQYSYGKLLRRLHDTDFRYSIPRDRNRADDGMELRYRFALAQGYEDSPEIILDALDGPCSVFEMMVALAIRCEEDYMDDPLVGDRTCQWFWNMIVSLGLGAMYDLRYNESFVDETIDRFLDRDYEPNGKGGLFTIKHGTEDMRYLEIEYQLFRYLNNLV